jgi:Protein of unknown function (DUF3435)
MHSNTFPVPEVIYDPSLIFSPHVLLLGLIFDDCAFAPPSLKTAEHLSQLQIPPGKNQLPIPLKTRFDNTPVFRRAERTIEGWVVSKEAALTYNVVYNSLKTIGKIVNFKQIARPYALRYAGGKAFNDNGRWL